jgi:integrase
MARPATGKVIEHNGKDGLTYRSLRFTAYGKRRYVSLGVVTTGEAERELRHILADVERGTWTPAAIEPPPEPEQVPTFHAFAEEWWMLNHAQLAESTRADYRWRLERHLLPYFGGMRLDTITFAAVERYVAAKLGEVDPLSARSINMTVTLLGAILERAVEQDPPLLHRNPTKGKARKAKERAPVRSYLDAAGQIKALLDAARELDRRATTARRHIERRAMIATLTFAGLRISELCALRWRDVDLAGGWLHVGEAKTDAGRRKVKVRGALRDVLLDLRGRHPDTEQSAYVFATLRDGPQSPDNFRSRVLKAAVTLANKNLAEDHLPPLPERITPHSLRRTFCSLLYALGEDPGVVMDEMGHTDPALALRVYRQAMRRGEDEKAQLRVLIEGGAEGHAAMAAALEHV